MPFRYLISPSGGLSYHLIARRRARTTWAPFRAAVRLWLKTWFDSLQARELIVFGPSAGWTLPLDEFARFSRVLFVEPDPTARFLLRRRLPSSLKAEFISRSDLLPWTGSDGNFTRFLESHPGAAVLFANVLGQIPLVASRSTGRDEFLSALKGRPWASYHDLYSGSSADASLLPSRNPQDVFAGGDVIDHETTWLAEGRTPQVALWPLTGKTLHIIDFVHS